MQNSAPPTTRRSQSLNPGIGYMNQCISFNSRPHGFFFSIHSNFLQSQFVSLNYSYPFPLHYSKSSIFLLALFFNSPELQLSSVLTGLLISVFSHAQITLNNSFASFLKICNSQTRQIHKNLPKGSHSQKVETQLNRF